MCKNNRWLHLRRLTCLVAITAMLAACGADDRRGGGGSESPTSNNPGGGGGGGGETTGDSQKSSFDVEVEDNGQSSHVKGEQPNTEASQDTWGATIAENRLLLTLLGDNGVAISATIETTQSLQAPGRFTVQSPPDDTHVVLLDAMAGQSFSSETTGTIRLDSCPKAVGQKAVGAFENIVLRDEFGGGTRTLSGSFDIMVYAKVGDLHCKPEQTEPSNPDPGPGGSGGTCDDFEPCRENGVCCPYEECVGTCSLACYFENMECMGGLNPTACATCISNCFDSCNVSQECRNAWQAVDQCGERYGCDEEEDFDDQDACVLEHCCSEVKAAYP